MDSCQHPDGPLVEDWDRCKAIKAGNYGAQIPGCALEVDHEGPHLRRWVERW